MPKQEPWETAVPRVQEIGKLPREIAVGINFPIQNKGDPPPGKVK
jgi:hypothetical protein